MFIPDCFELYELVPKDTYYQSRYVSRLWGLFDDRLLKTIHNLRRRYGKMAMNTWYWGGEHQYRGWRNENCPIGAKLSQHKYGRAGDLVPVFITAKEIRKDILNDPWHDDFKHISCVEMEVPWLHIDCRNRDKRANGILQVYPK